MRPKRLNFSKAHLSGFSRQIWFFQTKFVWFFQTIAFFFFVAFPISL